MRLPTGRSLEALRDMGFECDPVERFNHHCNQRFDLLGCIDIVAVREGFGTLGVQATSNNGGNHAAHRDKAIAEPRLKVWLACGNRYEIWSWAKRRTMELTKKGKRGRRKIWTLRREELVLQDGAVVALEQVGHLAGEMGRAA